jgi:hypothetical protein
MVAFRSSQIVRGDNETTRNVIEFRERSLKVILSSVRSTYSIGGRIARPIYRVINIILTNIDAPNKWNDFCFTTKSERNSIDVRQKKRKTDSDQTIACMFRIFWEARNISTEERLAIVDLFVDI